MNHDGKVKVAKKIAKKLVHVYGDEIQLVLLDGSVARGDDTEYSDLEVRVVTSRQIRTKAMSEDGYTQWLYHDLIVLLEFRTKNEVIELLSKLTFYWPVQVWRYV